MSYGNITVAVKCKIQLVKVIVFTQATVVKTTEAATSVASNVATAMFPVHTSAKACLTSVATRIQIRIQIQIPIWIATKISCKSFWSFWVKLLTNKQTDRQRRKHILLGWGNKDVHRKEDNYIKEAYLNSYLVSIAEYDLCFELRSYHTSCSCITLPVLTLLLIHARLYQFGTQLKLVIDNQQQQQYILSWILRKKVDQNKQFTDISAFCWCKIKAMWTMWK